MPAELPGPVHLRDTVLPTDPAAVRQMVASTGFFHPPEIDVAVELVQEHLSRGPASGYLFLFAEHDGRVVGYACYGPIACTVGSFDLYWIAVHSDQRGRGLGRHLLAITEERVAQIGGRRVYIETSGRAQYEPTQHFYEACGYAREAVLRDFYAPGDDKIIYGKVIASAPSTVF
jgi:GNAT superfamily N-acetyltransferase